MIVLEASGDYSKTDTWFKKLLRQDVKHILDYYGKLGVDALASSTPKRTGVTADAWDYTVTKTDDGYEIEWMNHNVNKGLNVAVLIQYGHGTRHGGYVRGIDYINPALEPVFEEIADKLYQEVTQNG